MKARISSLFLKDISNWKYWLTIAFISRFIFFILVNHFRQYNSFPGFWGGLRGDSEGYLIPFENLIRLGSYTPNYRMPGYGVLYYPLLLLFSKAVACNILICIQLLLSTLSVYALALIAKKLFKSTTLFYITFILYTCSIFSSLVDPVLISESLTTSTLILSVYFLCCYFNNYKAKELIFSGSLLTWTVFLRPVFAPLLLLFFVLVVIELVRSHKKNLPALLFLVPFTIADGSWITSNYIRYKEVIPLTRTVYFPWIENSYLKPMITFVQSWGGTIWFVNPSTEISWFSDNKPCTFKTGAKSDSVPYPSYIYTSQFNADSLKILKNTIIHFTSDSSHLSAEVKAEYQKAISDKFNKYALSEKTENKYCYYIKSNERRLSTMLLNIHTVSKLFINNYISRFTAGYYAVLLFLGLLGSLLMFPFIFKASLKSILPIIPLYTIFIHATIIKANENRYLIPAWPFLVICAAYTLYWGYGKLFPVKDLS